MGEPALESDDGDDEYAGFNGDDGDGDFQMWIGILSCYKRPWTDNLY